MHSSGGGWVSAGCTCLELFSGVGASARAQNYRDGVNQTGKMYGREISGTLGLNTDFVEIGTNFNKVIFFRKDDSFKVNCPLNNFLTSSSQAYAIFQTSGSWNRCLHFPGTELSLLL